MPININEITIFQKEKLLNQHEGHFLDFKSKNISPSALTKYITAFANADGGELFIGIEETQSKFEWDGFSKPEEANGHLQCFEGLFPLGQYFEYSFLHCACENGFVLKVDVKKTPDVKTASNQKVYLRRGAQSLPQDTGDQITRLKYNKGIFSFENELVAVGIDTITNSHIILEFILEIIPTAEPEIWLRKQLLIRDSKPTVASLLLYSDEPQAVLPKRSGIKLYRYKTSDLSGTRETLAFDPISIEGHLYSQIKEAVSKTVEIVENISVLGVKGFEKVKYPLETIHEIITNAVIHRDYSIADDIHIRIFDNRIEVQSPGTLPAHITVKNILDERFSRNGALVRLINKFPNPPNKDVGEGLNTAFQAMRTLKLKDPVIMQTENAVIIHVKHEPLASPEEIIMEYLQTHDTINNSKARSICYIGSENVVKRMFEGLVKQKLIKKVFGLKGRATAYQKVR